MGFKVLLVGFPLTNNSYGQQVAKDNFAMDYFHESVEKKVCLWFYREKNGQQMDIEDLIDTACVF